MRFFSRGGIGDVLAVTAVAREWKRANPDEMLRVDTTFPELWQGNPHLNHGATESGTRIDFGLALRHPHGSIVRGFCHQALVAPLDDTPEIFLTPDEVDRGRLRAAAFESGPLVAVDVFAKWPTRRWPFERFQAVVDIIGSWGATVIEIGSRSPDYHGIAERRCLEGVAASFVDGLSVRDAAAFLACCDLFLGNDSGGMHLAAAVGTKQVVVMGVTKDHTGAYSTTRIVRAPVDCAPGCGILCRQPTAFCMDAVPVEEVVEAVSEHLTS